MTNSRLETSLNPDSHFTLSSSNKFHATIMASIPDIGALGNRNERFDEVICIVLKRIQELQGSDLGQVVKESGIMWAAGLIRHFASQLQTSIRESNALCEELHSLTRKYTEKTKLLELEQLDCRKKTMDTVKAVRRSDKRESAKVRIGWAKMSWT